MSDGSHVWGGGLDRTASSPEMPGRGIVRPPLGRRLLGGPPTAVAARLVLASLVVGAAMMWLRIEPTDVAVAAAHAVHHLYVMGFLAAGQIGRYLAAGAAVVVPVWLVSRLISLRAAP